MAPLRILISNDDGVFADGIRTLAAAAAARGHQVTVVCPDQEVGHRSWPHPADPHPRRAGR